MSTTVAVVTWRGGSHLQRCLDSLARDRAPHRLLVVANDPDPATAALLGSHPSRPQVLWLRSNLGYAGAIAAALAAAETSLLCWLNDDAEPEPGWLAAMQQEMTGPVGAVGAVLRDSSGRVGSAGVQLTRLGYGFDLRSAPAPGTQGAARSLARFAVCGAALLVRCDALRAVGGVPAEFFCYYEDVDCCWRLRRAGWQVRLAPGARVWHAGGVSSHPGSSAFHYWNERNRLLMLVRNAPAGVVLEALLRFVTTTLLLPLRQVRARAAVSQNHRATLRWRVLGGVVAGMPAAVRARMRFGPTTGHGRTR